MSVKVRRSNKSNPINNKIIEPLKDDAYVLGPGQMASSLTRPIINGVKQSNKRKRKHKDSQSDYQSLDEMLVDADNNLDLNYETDEGPANGGGPLIHKSDNLVHVLVEGLQSENEKMVRTTLERCDSNVIRNVVNDLPNDMVEPLLRELHRLFFSKDDKLMNYFLWLQTLIQTKLSVILVSHNAQQELASIKQLFATRCDIFDRMCALKGRLSLISNLIEPSNKDKSGQSSAATIKYQETSSEDEDEEEDEHSSDHDSDDKEWDRINVMDIQDVSGDENEDDVDEFEAEAEAEAEAENEGEDEENEGGDEDEEEEAKEEEEEEEDEEEESHGEEDDEAD